MDFPPSLRADGMGTDTNTLVLKGDAKDKENENDPSRHGSALSQLFI